jgi:hypothetical protein
VPLLDSDAYAYREKVTIKKAKSPLDLWRFPDTVMR